MLRVASARASRAVATAVRPAIAAVATQRLAAVAVRSLTTKHAATSTTRMGAVRSASVGVQRRGFASFPDHLVLTMPALSPTMEKGNIASWKVKIGDKVKAGDVMAEVETDKATVAFESVETGYIAKILVQDGAQDVPVGTPVAILAEEEADVKAFENFKAEGEAAPAAAAAPAAPKEEKKAEAAPAAAESAAPAASSSSSASAGGRVVASPAARRVAGEQGVSLDGIQGTGPNSRIVTADVKEQAGQAKQASASASSSQAAPARAAPAQASSAGDYTDIPHSNVRKVIASRLSQSKQTIPHYYLSVDVTMDAVNKLRAELNAQLEAGAGKGPDAAKPAKLSVNDFIIKASALACKKVPAANSSWQDNSIRQFNYVDVSVAVSTDAGLVTPIVRDADTKGLAGISADVKALAAKARANKLSPAEYQGGTFTISNLGMFGVSSFAAIINPPQAAILAVGGSQPRLTQAKDGSVSSAQVMSVTLSCDHRVVDGAVGAQWLQAFKGFLEKPSTMLL